MSNSKISALTSATTPLAGTEVLPIVQSGATTKVTVANLTAGRAVSMADATLSTGNATFSAINKGISAPGALWRQTYSSVAAGGTLDLTLDANGFVGILSVSNTRDNYTPQSRRVVYAIACYGTTMTTTQLHLQDGVGGGPSFTITVPSAGTLRWTDTSGDGSTHSVYLTFDGSRSAG